MVLLAGHWNNADVNVRDSPYASLTGTKLIQFDVADIIV